MTEPLDWARVPSDRLPDRRVLRRLQTWERMNQMQGRTVVARKDGSDLVLEAYPSHTLSLAYPSVEQQIASLRAGSRPLRSASVQTALGVPAIFRAASLIANLTGSLTMRVLHNQVELAPDRRPSIVKRPDPNRTPRDFFRDTAWNLAGYGEAWWFVSSRDRDNVAATLFNVPDPREVQVEDNERDPLRPHITWRGRSTRDGSLNRDDMRQLTFLPDSTGLRGIGPLQMCGVAATVSVEAQEWAANFFSVGGYPSIWIKTAGDLSGGADEWSTEEQTEEGINSEAERLKAEWIRTPPNTPKVTDEQVLDIKSLDVSIGQAQALEARNWQNGEAARMYGIPGSLLEFQQAGASLTYQNLEGEFTKLVRGCLRPGYLEPIEQAMSDLLTRANVARFDTEIIEAPDVKTRYEVYQIGIMSGVITPEIAQAKEGYRPGDVENAAVPQPSFRPPVPVRLSGEVRCDGVHPDRPGRCNKLLSTAGAFIGQCPRCKKQYASAA